MYLSLLQIRFKQIYRTASNLGLFRALFVAILLFLLLLAFFTYLGKSGFRNWLTVGYLSGLLSTHLNRPDKQFLIINAQGYNTVFLLDYVFLAIPLLVCQLFYQQFILAPTSAIVIGLIPFINISIQKRSLNNLIINAIPNEAFEWRAGVRKLFVFVLTIWFLAIIFSWFVATVPVAIFILGVSVFSFYDKGESIAILLSPELKSKRFLLRKITVAQLLFSTLLFPIVITFMIIHPELWYIPLIEFVLFSSILTYIVLLKYSFYRPNKKLIAGQMFSAIGALSVLLPFFIPLVWVLTIRFYFKSVSNLNIYMNDFN